METTCTWQFHLVHDGDYSSIPDELDLVMSELVALEACTEELSDSAVGLDLSEMMAEISVNVSGQPFEQAVATAMVAIRTAIHAAGGRTPEWPNVSDVLQEALRFEPVLVTAG